jgi:hypothetical protein
MQDNLTQSALLRCLSSLDVHAWGQVLLPKLIAQGSAQAVASTCSQLRDLTFPRSPGHPPQQIAGQQ